MSFAYARPASIEAACQLAAAGGCVLAGGQSLMPLINRGDVRPDLVVDINRLAGLDAIALRDGFVEIGALARLEQVRRDVIVREHLPLLSAALAFVANPAVRLRGTLVGNLVNFGPGAEAAAVALLHEAELIAASPDGPVRYPLGSRLDRHFIAAVRLRPSPSGSRAGFYEVQRRFGHLGTVGAGVVLQPDGSAKAAVSGYVDAPLLLPKVAASLAVGRFDIEALREAFGRDTDGVAARADIHATADYRRMVAPVAIRRALQAALAAGEGAS